ncbi:MAG: hypothetical protein Q8N16_00440 [bacterium]|nr:hypothetical protein [bacterium]
MMKFQGAKIESVKARTILDSRGEPTVEAEIQVLGMKVSASVPSGTSVGKYEAPVLIPAKAVLKINSLAKDICRMDFASQAWFDLWLKSRSAFANVTLPLSIAFSRIFETLPKPKSKKLPQLMVLAFEGGVHGDSRLKIQEILMVAKTVSRAKALYQGLKKLLEKKGIDTDVGLEGGFSPNDISDRQALEILAGFLGKKAKIGLDFGGAYFKGQKGEQEALLKEFSLFSVEDPFGEDDYQLWQEFFKKFAEKYLIVGDDLVATNVKRLRKALKLKLIKAVIVKPNQIGTISETLDFVKEARKAGLKIIVSHRSGETNDPFISDFAVAVNADFVKFGGMARGERIAKYNRLIELSTGK